MNSCDDILKVVENKGYNVNTKQTFLKSNLSEQKHASSDTKIPKLWHKNTPALAQYCANLDLQAYEA